ncbi:hypothetical protein BJY00DRAFT_320142 [Aspergillus carlsbadensis]|nr:hypothetical protein BJY00DRAFT_320142 [Aspergillus carlsbadensis]
MADKQSPGESQHLEFTDVGQGFSRTSQNNPPRINLKTALVFISLCLVAAAAMMTLVGTGAKYSRNITATIGGSEIAVWLNQCVAITTCILASPIAQASDYWGRK